MKVVLSIPEDEKIRLVDYQGFDQNFFLPEMFSILNEYLTFKDEAVVTHIYKDYFWISKDALEVLVSDRRITNIHIFIGEGAYIFFKERKSGFVRFDFEFTNGNSVQLKNCTMVTMYPENELYASTCWQIFQPHSGKVNISLAVDNWRIFRICKSLYKIYRINSSLKDVSLSRLSLITHIDCKLDRPLVEPEFDWEKLIS